MANEAHKKFLTEFFAKDVHIVTEWRDNSVWKTKKVGTIAAMSGSYPFRPGSHVQLVPKSSR